RWWILVDPAIDLGNRFLGITLPAGEKISFCQSQDMLMTVQLMNDFGISGVRLEYEIVVGPESARPRFPGQRISVPIDDRSEIDFAEAQELHFVPANLLCMFDCLVDQLGKSAANTIQVP